jgi:hypothetical protein
MRQELADIEAQIRELSQECVAVPVLRLLCVMVGRYSDAELAEHIRMLHEYNEMKDLGQDLLGRLGTWLSVCHIIIIIIIIIIWTAICEETLTRTLYPRFDLSLDD